MTWCSWVVRPPLQIAAERPVLRSRTPKLRELLQDFFGSWPYFNLFSYDFLKRWSSFLFLNDFFKAFEAAAHRDRPGHHRGLGGGQRSRLDRLSSLRCRHVGCRPFTPETRPRGQRWRCPESPQCSKLPRKAQAKLKAFGCIWT